MALSSLMMSMVAEAASIVTPDPFVPDPDAWYYIQVIASGAFTNIPSTDVAYFDKIKDKVFQANGSTKVVTYEQPVADAGQDAQLWKFVEGHFKAGVADGWKLVSKLGNDYIFLNGNQVPTSLGMADNGSFYTYSEPKTVDRGSEVGSTVFEPQVGGGYKIHFNSIANSYGYVGRDRTGNPMRSCEPANADIFQLIKLSTDPITISAAPTALDFETVADIKELPLVITTANVLTSVSYAVTGADSLSFVAIPGADWDAVNGGTLNISFIPSADRTYHAALTLSTPGATTIVDLTGIGNISFNSIDKFDGVEGTVIATKYYNLKGIEVSESTVKSTTGVYIKRDLLDSGKARVTKILYIK